MKKFYVCTTIPGAGAAVVGAAVVGGGGAVVGPAVVGAAVLGGGGAVVGAAVVGGSAVPKTNGMTNEILQLPTRIFLYGDLCYESNFVRILPSQQSADWCQLLPEDEKSILQLSFPQVRSPRQSESLSQSPPPTSQGCLLLQQFQFV